MRVLLSLLVLSVTTTAVEGTCSAGLKECDWSPWEKWAPCSSSCGGGQQNRVRQLCCELDLSYTACVNKCNLKFEDGQEIRKCGQLCLNGGTFENATSSCQCQTGFSGTCCEKSPSTGAVTTTIPTTTTTPTTTSTTTAIPITEDRKCQVPFWNQGIITAQNVNASSNAPGKTPGMAYSNCPNRPCGWCPDPTQPVQGQYIEVTLNASYVIQAIEIRPPEGLFPGRVSENYMTNYTIEYQEVGGSKFVTYGREQSGPVYMLGVRGNSITLVSTLTEIERPITQRFRIVVVDAKKHACFRFEIFGCPTPCTCQNGGSCISGNVCLCPPPYYGPNCAYVHLPETGSCLKPLGMWNEKIPDSQLTVSSFKPGHDKEKARYICCAGEDTGAWCPASNDTHPYYEINLGKPYLVAMLMFKQPNVEHYWQLPDTYLKRFRLEYHQLERDTMITYATNIDAIKNATISYSPILDPYIFTDVIKIIPLTWEKAPCFRFEIIGCDPADRPVGRLIGKK